jgi:heat shock protein HtpX
MRDTDPMANGLKTALLLGVLSGLLLLIGDSLGGQNGLVMAFGLAVVMNFASYWFSDKIVLMMYRAQPVGPEHLLRRITERLAERAGLPMPKVYVIPDPSPNAFATGRNPSHAAVAATEGILRVLNENQLEGVIAHELSHVKHRDILISSVAATMGAAIMMLARMAQFAAIFGGGSRDDDNRGGNPIGLLATVILAPIAAMLIQAAISRSREFAADAGAARLVGTPYGLVDALKTIDAVSKRVPMDANPATAHMFIMKPFSVSGMLSVFSTHPPLEKRIQALLGTV